MYFLNRNINQDEFQYHYRNRRCLIKYGSLRLFRACLSVGYRRYLGLEELGLDVGGKILLTPDLNFVNIINKTIPILVFFELKVIITVYSIVFLCTDNDDVINLNM